MKELNTNVYAYEIDKYLGETKKDTLIRSFWPELISHAHDESLYDMKGKCYIDLYNNEGSNLIGYNNPLFKRECNKYSDRLCLTTVASKWDIIAARMITEILCWVEKTIFINDKNSALNLACDLSIERSKYFGYHEKKYILTDSLDNYDFKCKTKPFKGFELDVNKIAAFVLNPAGEIGLTPDRIKFLRKAKEFCCEQGITLVFDETKTFGRYKKLFAANFININPDIIIFGNCLGNGEKIYAVSGLSSCLEFARKDINIHSHNPRCLIAASVILNILSNNQDYSIEYFQSRCEQFKMDFNKSLSKINLIGDGTILRLVGDNNLILSYIRFMANAGFIFNMTNYPSFPVVNHFDNILYFTKLWNDKIR